MPSIEEFLKNHAVDLADESSALSDEADTVSLHCALRGHGKDNVVVEVYGTIYKIRKADIRSADVSDAPIGTQSGIGVPVKLTLIKAAEMHPSIVITASDFVTKMPLTLSLPSSVGDVVLGADAFADHTTWLVERGYMPNTASPDRSTTSYCPSRSPNTYHPRLDDYRQDDHRGCDTKNDG